MKRYRRFRQSRDGLITWGTLLSVLLLMILVSLVSNTAITVNQKMETQNMADSAAYSGSIWMARGMNFVSATNHVIGELNAMYTMHHAMGGRWLDEHYSDGDRNSGDWKFTWPAPMEYGGFWYQMTNQFALPIGFWSAKILSELTIIGKKPDKKHYDLVKKHPIADIHSAIWEGKENLKNQMVAAYAMHSGGASMVLAGYAKIAKGTLMLSNPLTAAAGAAMIVDGANMVDKGLKIMKAAKALETAIYVEYLWLDTMEDFARGLAPVKLALPIMIQAIYRYQQVAIYILFPMNAIESADELAQRNGMSAFVLGDIPSLNPGDYNGPSDIFTQGSSFLPSLPVEAEKVTDEEKSQMIRASNPWVRFWRPPLVLAFMGAPTSMASTSYIKWTNRFAYQCSEYYRTPTGEKCKNEATCINRKNEGLKGQGIKMYVVKDLNEDGEKSEEDWNQDGILGSTRADAIFCVMGYAKSKRPPLKSPAFFRQENPHGMVCYSQAMVYNANPQPAAGETSGGSSKQPDVGWDTLAWDHEAHRVPDWKDRGKYFWGHMFDVIPDGMPRTKLNWQAKLTPVTAEKITKTASVAAIYDSAAGDGEISQILLNGQQGNFLDKATHVGAQAWLQNH